MMATYAQFGYAYPPASQLLVHGGQATTSPGAVGGVGPPLSPGAGGALSPGGASHASGTPAAPSCCDGGRAIMTDPVTGQSVCSCQYEQARLALSTAAAASYPRVGVYGTPYPSTDQNPYPSIGVDSSAFYSPLSNPYGLKDGSGAGDMAAWTSAGLQPSTGYYPYDPTLAAYGYGAGYDLAARRKNATRESTATLKAWLNEHKKNPYPTKGEKIMLAIITKMTLTQVSTWFANARRRLKKENKMTWEPKNKTDDDDDAMVSDDEKDKDDLMDEKLKGHKDEEIRKGADEMLHHGGGVMHHQLLGYGTKDEMKASGGATDCGVPIPATKPKIWSLADTAACKTPPPPSSAQPWPYAHASGYGFAPSAAPAAAAYVHPYNGYYPQSQYPDVQTDTPPQTPPGMKVGASGAYASSRHEASYHAPHSHHQRASSHPHHGQHHPQQHGTDSAAAAAAAAAFKPFYKSSQQLSNGFVSPV